jgi:parallel beta-helix repeat protein
MSTNLFRNVACLFSLAMMAPLSFVAGCGDDGTGGTGGAGGSGGADACEGIDVSACSVTISPSDDSTKAIQTALIEAKSGDTVCLCPGSYEIKKELSLTVPNVTLRGAGATRDLATLDFAKQAEGDDGLTATSPGFTVENLTVKNTIGNGIVVTGTEDVTFRNLKVSWDAGSVTTNGAYAVYPVSSERVLIEDCEITGASDAGIYVGQSTQVIVRNNKVYANVAGIESENTTDCEIYDNEAYDNTAGILVFVLPNLDKKDGFRTHVRNNKIYNNNRDNFGDPMTTVGAVPKGTGALILAADETEFNDNEIYDNETVGIVVVGYPTLSLLLTNPGDDPMTDQYPEKTYIHDNTFMNNGTDPASPLDLIPVLPLENVIWDGLENPMNPAGAEMCLGMSPASFRSINGVSNIDNPAMHTTDTTMFECDHPTQAPIDF